MYKVIIVDDELVVRDGLKQTIEWEEHGFALIGDYENGRDAWEAIEAFKPDLVISDISMPLMDGLELAGMVSANYPYIKMIILTGYDQFEYAQQAIRLKVSDFILKPITAKDMRALLVKVRLEMDEETKRREDLGRLRSQLHLSLPLLRERFLERLVVLGLGRQEIEGQFAFFGLPAVTPPFIVMLADIDDFGEREAWMDDGHDAEFFRFAVYNIFEEVISTRSNALLFRTREERLVVILNGAEGEDELYVGAYGMAEEARHHIERYLKFTVTIGIGRACSSPEQLPVSYKSAQSALDYRFQLGKNRILSINDLEGSQGWAMPAALSGDWDRKLSASVKTGSGEAACRQIECLIEEFRRSRMPIEAVFLQTQRVVLTLMNVMQELGAHEAEDLRKRQLWLTDIYRFKTLDEIEVWLKAIASELAASALDNRNLVASNQIAKATEYIEEHYAEEKLSLQHLCRHTLMSTSYFSLLFKQYTGETFVEYLTRVRLERAKELLLATSLKFYEIASQVGYADPNYFSILFKKHTGSSPRDFREKQAKESLR
ncbi:response regulator [Paenibacillus harenae]|uniref:response regulator n=1 Tax=Paenibacillus harenae TaxID=306543 RepID=UPI002790208C|nr:response regulator [Paenibacillus harenae]MDQ0063267.1 two-component system response regulator YesN [Paenibacillus harenae]